MFLRENIIMTKSLTIDSQSKAKFQQLAEAWRVLSDPESRAVYARYGDRGLVKNSVDVTDPSTLFAMVFGSDQFVHLIGELQLLPGNVDESSNTPTEMAMEQIKRARVGKPNSRPCQKTIYI